MEKAGQLCLDSGGGGGELSSGMLYLYDDGYVLIMRSKMGLYNLQTYHSFVMPVHLYYIYVGNIPVYLAIVLTFQTLVDYAICVFCVENVLCIFLILSVCPYGFDMFFTSNFESMSCLSDILKWALIAFPLQSIKPL
jgi:hypothetical protein